MAHLKLPALSPNDPANLKTLKCLGSLQSRSLVASVSVKSRQSLGEKPTGGVASIFCNR